jgi:hypothetical protein
VYDVVDLIVDNSDLAVNRECTGLWTDLGIIA